MLEKELLVRLDMLAAKMGVAANKLWAIYVRQQYVDGVLSLVWAALGVATICLGVWLIGEYQKDKYKHREHDVWGAFCICVGVVPTLIGSVCAVLNFANPELEAFKEIVSTLM